MSRIFFPALLLFLFITFLAVFFVRSKEPHSGSNVDLPKEVIRPGMQLTSPAFLSNQKIPAKYTCDGENINPPLTISEVPDGVQSFVLIITDPDSPSSNFTHWLIWNIPKAEQINEGEVPSGAVQGINDFGQNNYGGPCPPSGTHKYQFKLYALNTVLDLPSGAGKSALEAAIVGHIVDQTVLVGIYKRSSSSRDDPEGWVNRGRLF